MKSLFAIFKQAYLHFFAVIGALSLASLIASLDLYDWPTSILTMISWWKSLAYPVVDAVFHPVLRWLSEILEFEIQMSDATKDYLGVGVALAFSRFRGALFGWKKQTLAGDARQVADREKVLKSLTRNPVVALQLLLRTVIVWPVELALMTRLVLFARRVFPEAADDYIRNVRISHGITLLPIFYFTLLVATSWTIAVYQFFGMKP